LNALSDSCSSVDGNDADEFTDDEFLEKNNGTLLCDNNGTLIRYSYCGNVINAKVIHNNL